MRLVRSRPRDDDSAISRAVKLRLPIERSTIAKCPTGAYFDKRASFNAL